MNIVESRRSLHPTAGAGVYIEFTDGSLCLVEGDGRFDGINPGQIILKEGGRVVYFGQAKDSTMGARYAAARGGKTLGGSFMGHQDASV